MRNIKEDKSTGLPEGFPVGGEEATRKSPEFWSRSKDGGGTRDADGWKSDAKTLPQGHPHSHPRWWLSWSLLILYNLMPWKLTSHPLLPT